MDPSLLQEQKRAQRRVDTGAGKADSVGDRALLAARGEGVETPTA